MSERKSPRCTRPRKSPYAGRLAQERRRFDGVSEFDDLPPIYHYWSNTFVRAMLEPVGHSAPEVSWRENTFRESARRCGTNSGIPQHRLGRREQ